MYLNNEERRAQNDAQIYHCIKNSLASEAERKIPAERESYHINNVPSGPLLFKLLMQKAIIDTWATASLMREYLLNLDSYITTVKSDIEEFSRYVTSTSVLGPFVGMSDSQPNLNSRAELGSWAHCLLTLLAASLEDNQMLAQSH